MGNELRAELDALENELSLYVELHTNWGHVSASDSLARTKDFDLPERILRDARRVQAKLNLKLRTSDAIEAWYADGLAKLRSHGRALDWPEKPWSAA